MMAPLMATVTSAPPRESRSAAMQLISLSRVKEIAAKTATSALVLPIFPHYPFPHPIFPPSRHNLQWETQTDLLVI